LFDNHVIHDWRGNTYAFKHEGHCFTLTQLAPHKHLKFKYGKRSEKSLYVSEK